MNAQSDRTRRWRSAWRRACAVHARLAARNERDPPPRLPHDAWNDAVAAAERLTVVRRRGWGAAEPVATSQLDAALTALVGRLQALGVAAQRPARHVPPLAEVARDLAALATEFTGATLDGDELVVVTDPIELQGLSLGEFALRLDLAADPARGLPLRVVALAPYPSRANDDVPHPHVSGEELCAGDGRHSLLRAIVDGRLLDVFEIAARVLAHYNPGSAYVELENWDGIRCQGCDDCVSATSVCEACHDDLCDECVATCEQCDDCLCERCAQDCRGCGETLCPACAAACPCCRQPCCAACRDDELRCPDCQPGDDLPENFCEDQVHDQDHDENVAPPTRGDLALAAPTPDPPLRP